jgi:hypothetical protein
MLLAKVPIQDWLFSCLQGVCAMIMALPPGERHASGKNQILLAASPRHTPRSYA